MVTPVTKEPPPDCPPAVALAFPVIWEHPNDECLCWTLDRVHWPDPMPSLVFSIAGDALVYGLCKAAHAYERPISSVQVRRINTYRYQATVPLNTSVEDAHAQHTRFQEKLRVAMAKLDETWTQEWLPEVKEHLTYWENFDLGGASIPMLLVHLDETVVRAARMWEIHFLLSSPMYAAINKFGRLYQELFGGSMLDAYRLLQGFDNKTLQAGKTLWQLSRRALAMLEVREIIEKYAAAELIPALEGSLECQAFLVDLRAYLNEYGQRRGKLSIDCPAWIEDPTPVFEYLKTYITLPDRDLSAEMAALMEERNRLVVEAREYLKGYPRVVADEFEFLLRAAQEAVVLVEDHNFWIDCRGLYQVRRVFLEFGHRFVSANELDRPEDIFYLTLDEIKARMTAPTYQDLRTMVHTRRAELEMFRSITPPAGLGVQSAESPSHDRLGRVPGSGRMEHTRLPDGRDVLHGHAGASGLARGTARVVHSLDEAGKLAPGEILVVETTTPSWTPLFAIAAAVVTGTGGILCHCAIVAREYRLPAVVGVERATSLIRDGQLLEVDGDRGIVRLMTSSY